MTLTPEQLANSREEFEEIFKGRYPRTEFGVFEHGVYWNSDINKYWTGFLLRQESITVELPAMFHDSVSGYEADEMKTAIKSAGINYIEKE